jgi:thioredoxin reductase
MYIPNMLPSWYLARQLEHSTGRHSINHTSKPMIHDTLILGGGPAGLSTALGLARQLYSVVVFDSQQYRNAPAQRMHNVLTWDHKSPEEFRARARANILERYDTVTIREVKIDSLVKTKDGNFEATDCNGGKTFGKTVVLAVGVADRMMFDISGFEELWGRSM